MTDDGLEFGAFDPDSAETVAIGQTKSGAVSLSLNNDREGALLQAPNDFQPIWTLSAWQPGAPLNASGVREITLGDPPIYTLALSPQERVLWLHHRESGYNQLLPVTGVLVELARIVRPMSNGRLSHEAFFSLAEQADDRSLATALLEYNKRARKFDASQVSITDNTRSQGIFNFFGKRR